MQFLFTLFVSFAGIFASTLAVAGECDDRVLGYLPDQVVVYVIPSVSGTFRLPRLETDLILGDGYAYRARRADNPPPSKPTDIFSEDPNITVNFVFKETDETYRKVYIRGPRNAVLSHLLQVTERESANIGVDFVSRLASQNPNILEQFLSQFPLAEAETEVAKAVELSAQISNRRLEIEKDRELAQLTDSSAVIVTVGSPLAFQANISLSIVPSLLKVLDLMNMVTGRNGYSLMNLYTSIKWSENYPLTPCWSTF